MASRLYNTLTTLVLLLALALAGWMGIIFLNPASPLNPLRPSTPMPPTQVLAPLVVAALPTLTPSPEASATPLPTETPLPPTPTPPIPPSPIPASATPPPTPTPTLPPPPANSRPPVEAPPPATAAAPAGPPAPTAVPASQTGPAGAGGFELGGQVAGFNQPDLMKYAGMTWVKRQLRWSPGANPSDAGGDIADAHGKGFKILLSVLGDPESLRGGNHFADFAAYVGAVAALGADGIEVWNEMNIDREWPVGEISPAGYTALLRQAHAAIKANNPATLVVSGAPAPTGFFGGCWSTGCDDKPYVEGMVSAGALNYLDCIGIHYNEGIVPPTQSSGDPRGNPNHYTRYYPTMVDTYFNAGGGRKKLCFTELGYLSGDGYHPPLAEVAPTFAWAADTSVDEHAAWLASAARLARDGGRVRLMIVFNVDLTGWGSDPQGGYAIIRAGGGCPACEALRAVMGAP